MKQIQFLSSHGFSNRSRHISVFGQTDNPPHNLRMLGLCPSTFTNPKLHSLESQVEYLTAELQQRLLLAISI